jgi:hypothetical protein
VLVRLLVVRGAVLWVVLRGVTLVGNAMTAEAPGQSVVPLSAVAATWLVVACGVMIALDVRRRREHFLLSNVGVGTAARMALGLLPSALGEAVIATLWSA